MTRAVNDATLTKAGDIYQYLNALRDCFELNDGETLQIEINGDVSIINNTGGLFIMVPLSRPLPSKNA